MLSSDSTPLLTGDTTPLLNSDTTPPLLSTSSSDSEVLEQGHHATGSGDNGTLLNNREDREQNGTPQGGAADAASADADEDLSEAPAARYRRRSVEVGRTPLEHDVARVGKQARLLQNAGVASDIVAAAVERAAERNQPGLIERIAGDIEQERARPRQTSVVVRDGPRPGEPSPLERRYLESDQAS